MEGHDFPCKFQLILEEVENDQEELPFIFVHNNNYSKVGLMDLSIVIQNIMTSVQDFFHVLF